LKIEYQIGYAADLFREYILDIGECMTENERGIIGPVLDYFDRLLANTASNGYEEAVGDVFHDSTIPDSTLAQRFEAASLRYFCEARQLSILKEKDYGSAWTQDGVKGLYIALRNKVARLRTLVWYGNPAQVAGETIRDTLIDLLNYTLFALYLLETNNWDGRSSETPNG